MPFHAIQLHCYTRQLTQLYQRITQMTAKNTSEPWRHNYWARRSFILLHICSPSQQHVFLCKERRKSPHLLSPALYIGNLSSIKAFVILLPHTETRSQIQLSWLPKANLGDITLSALWYSKGHVQGAHLMGNGLFSRMLSYIASLINDIHVHSLWRLLCTLNYVTRFIPNSIASHIT